MRRPAVGAAAALCLLAACSRSATSAVPLPSARPLSPSPSTPSPSPVVPPSPAAAAFSTTRALATMRALARAGPREATSAAYRRAARIVEDALEPLGYRVRRQRFRLPAALVDWFPVRAGTSFNLVAEPPGFRGSRPHLVVGGHLDTVPDAPGANDNASGIAVMVELARLASQDPPALPIVFVAFGAEEARRYAPPQRDFAIGSRRYIEEMSGAREKALVGAINLDMVGAGNDVEIVGRDGPMVRALVRAARRLDIAYLRRTTIARGSSDHVRFESAGIPVGWLWAGEHPTLHTPRDVAGVVQRAEVRRIGRVAWEMLRTFRD